MESLGFVFGIIGMSVGLVGFVFGLLSMTKVDKLEKRLQSIKIID